MTLTPNSKRGRFRELQPTTPTRTRKWARSKPNFVDFLKRKRRTAVSGFIFFKLELEPLDEGSLEFSFTVLSFLPVEEDAEGSEEEGVSFSFLVFGCVDGIWYRVETRQRKIVVVGEDRY
jgi:hypothetical protein